MTGARPPVTVAIPLHASEPFVDVVLANIAAIDVAGAEILVSDRTMVDGAAARIAAATANDPRVRVVAAADGLGWAAHHALLLDQATAPLVMLMPHDDDFGPDWVRTLADALADRPDALVAFGDLRVHGTEHVAGRPPAVGPPSRARRPRASDAARLFTYWHIAIAYRGVFRADRLEELGLRPQAGVERADDLFMFEVALEGTLLHVPGPTTDKRWHEGSTHTRFSTSPLSSGRFHLRALRALVRRGRDRTVAWAAVIVARRWVAFVMTDRRRRRQRP